MALEGGQGISLFMPARTDGAEVRGAKVVSLFSGNRAVGLPTITGVILLLDEVTGLPLALMDAGELTAIRTAAAAGLAAKLLSRSDSRVLGLFGAGAQAPWQVEAVRAVRPIEEVRLMSRTGASAERLAGSLTGVEARVFEDPRAVVDGADIVVAVTTSSTPVFKGTDVRPGTHVSGSGSYTLEMQEVDADVVRRARVVVEHRESALEEAGDLVIPMRAELVGPDVIDCELGEIVNGVAPEGRDGRDLTFFKSVGTAVQDLAVGALVYRKAVEAGVGALVEI